MLLAENGKSAIATLEKEPVDILISDIKMPDLRRGRPARGQADRSDILGIAITAFASTETAVEAMRLGACDYLSKPFDVDLLRMKVREKIESRQLRQENVLLKRTLGLTHQFTNIIGRSEVMLDVFKMIETVAKTNSTILLTGESGTGKGLVAQAIHFHSLRRDRPHVAVNCGALPEALLESELFGHMRGAFTGAESNKKGLIEVAERGTVFLDEIGEMSAVMQVKFLRVLQERKFRRVGGLEEMQADIRVVAATNQDLSKLVADGRFREDLFYRINVIGIHLPPLRDRREDIPLLAEHFLANTASRWGRPSAPSRTRRWRCCRATTGRATFASSRTRSSAPWRSRPRLRFSSTASAVAVRSRRVRVSASAASVLDAPCRRGIRSQRTCSKSNGDLAEALKAPTASR